MSALVFFTLLIPSTAQEIALTFDDAPSGDGPLFTGEEMTARIHLLLLHENDVAACFPGDLITHLRSYGRKIIPPAEAYEDLIAGYSPTFCSTVREGCGHCARARKLTKKISFRSLKVSVLENLMRKEKGFRMNVGLEAP